MFVGRARSLMFLYGFNEGGSDGYGDGKTGDPEN
jgi:hypothetical protein